jgi:hypothetical protein
MQVNQAVEDTLNIRIAGDCVHAASVNVCHQERSAVCWRRREDFDLVDEYLSGFWEMVSINCFVFSV